MIDDDDAGSRSRRFLSGLHEDNDQDRRTLAQKDRDKLLYSEWFQRLTGVTQTLGTQELRLLHNRLTHSLKVAQIARRIAERLVRQNPGHCASIGLDPDSVEAGGLAHDLGHPPFGHIAEDVLNDLLQPLGGFEGNAQSFRIATKLSLTKTDTEVLRGTDLSRATFGALLKYPLLGPGPRTDGKWNDQDKFQAFNARAKETDWHDRSFGRKWGAYATEQEAFEWVRHDSVVSGRYEGDRTPEAIIVDWADDITYAVHDLQDFYRAGIIPRGALEPIFVGGEKRAPTQESTQLQVALASIAANYPGWSPARLEDAFRKFGWKTPPDYQGSSQDDCDLREFSHLIIQRLVNGVSMVETQPHVSIDEGAQYLAEYFKALTGYYIVRRPQLGAIQEGQQVMLSRLFGSLVSWSYRELSQKREERVPVRLHEYIRIARKDLDLVIEDGGLSKEDGARTKRVLFEAADEAMWSAEYAPVYADAELRRVLDAASTSEGNKRLVLTCMRGAADYLVNLTEQQAIDLHRRVSAASDSSVFGSWFH